MIIERAINGAVFEKRQQDAQVSDNSGQANFSWCQFKEDADFWGAQFLGPVYFWRTIFQRFAKLEAHFDSAVTFEGNRALHCFERSDFGDQDTLFEDMNRGGLLLQDEEDASCADAIWPFPSPAHLSYFPHANDGVSSVVQ